MTAKQILTFVEAFSHLVDQDIKYLELSINSADKKTREKYWEISDYFSDRTKELVNGTIK